MEGLDEEPRRLADWTLWGEAQRGWVGAVCVRDPGRPKDHLHLLSLLETGRKTKRPSACVYICMCPSEQARVGGMWRLITWSESAEETPSFLAHWKGS